MDAFLFLGLIRLKTLMMPDFGQLLADREGAGRHLYRCDAAIDHAIWARIGGF